MKYPQVQKKNKSLADQIMEEHFQKVPTEFCDQDQPTCPVCFDQIHQNSVTAPCAHLYHRQCYAKAIEYDHRCSLCRTPMTEKVLSNNELRDTDIISEDDPFDDDTPFYSGSRQTRPCRTTAVLLDVARRIEMREMLRRRAPRRARRT